MQNPIGYGEEGDKYYMAPEILNESPTTAADIYSVGVTALELATDVDLDNDRELIRSENIPSRLFGVLSTDLVQLIKLMLTADPLRRPSAQMLLSDLQLHPRPLARLKDMERSPSDSSPSGVEDADWDFDIVEARDLTRQFELTQIRNFRSRLDFEEDHNDCSAPKKKRFHEMDANDNEIKPLRKRRLFD